ncbi:hypothetical protein OEZ85_005722 [Tetradesmus obliquus]|uniref:Uncharacterized protein n=1 Tax=Tetradesmus obliquus TaxID=3088 RepID=A0ABY8UE88_TETOB|nr:hypothetical protein OEZ85_005722 [Tetradesmus obliquus]
MRLDSLPQRWPRQEEHAGLQGVAWVLWKLQVALQLRPTVWPFRYSSIRGGLLQEKASYHPRGPGRDATHAAFTQRGLRLVEHFWSAKHGSYHNPSANAAS